MHDAWTDKLSEYLDDALPADERRAVAAHLAECASCAETLDGLARVVDAAHALAPRPPARDLWSGIADRLDAERPTAAAPRPVVRFDSRPARRLSFTLPQLAAASLLLAAVSGGLTWTLRGSRDARALAPVVAGDRAQSNGAADAPVAPDAAPAPRLPAANVSFADAQYDAAVSDLEKALNKGRSRLDPTTVAIVEQNLQIIDDAIAQARQALNADPANSYLSSHLVETRRKKLDLLRRAAALTESD